MRDKQTTLKTPKGSVCRFFKPEETHCGSTMIDKDGNIRLHRAVGCEYVNPFNPTIMSVLKCNHDVQFVLCTETKNTAAYACKYCIKNQNPVENYTALSIAAFAKASSRADTLPDGATPLQRGKKLLASMLYSVTNGLEVAATMAALYIFRESPFWFSHEPIRIDLGRMVEPRMDTDDIEVSVPANVCSGSHGKEKYIRSQTLLEKYWKRDKSLDDVAFIDFCERYDVTNKAAEGVNGARGVSAGVVYRRSTKRRVVVICGRDIPDISSHETADNKNYYFSAITTLFRPHRKATRVVSNHRASAAYREFVDNGVPELVQRMLAFEESWRDFYKAERGDPSTTEESLEEHLLRTRVPPSTPWCGLDATTPPPNGENDFDDHIMPDFAGDEHCILPTARTTEVLADKACATVAAVPNLRCAVDQAVGAYPAVESVSVQAGFDFDNYANLLIKSDSPDTRKTCAGTDEFIMEFPDAPTRLERFKECFSPVPWQRQFGPPSWTPFCLPSFPSISMVSEAFQLNFWQHVIFEVAARHLLFEYSNDVAAVLREPVFPPSHNTPPYELKNQLIAYLGGEAGTGKSTVIHALLTLANKWQREGSVETLAFTGVAAINIHGRTMHSARNLRLSGAESNPNPSVAMKMRFSRVILVIADEISMIDQALLGGTEIASQSLAGERKKLIGGKHVILTGDWLQLPSIAGYPCFAPPPTCVNESSTSTSKSTSTRQTMHQKDVSATLRLAGYALYSAINFVVFLIENMRAKEDTEYTEILSDLRWGRLSRDQISKLNTRVQSNQSTEHLPGGEFYRPVVVATNEIRGAINRVMTFETAKKHRQPVYECIAVPSTRSRTVMDHIINLNDDQTDRIPIKLLFYIGMPVMMTRKHPQLLDADVIANGVLGTIIGFSPPAETMTFHTANVHGVEVKTFEHQPRMLLVKVRGSTAQLVSGFPPGVIGIPRLRAGIKIAKIPTLQQTNLTVEQFALVPAFACTTEKLQGQTCRDGIVVTRLERRKGVPHQTLYVALSRSVSLSGLTLTEPITTEYLQRFQPSESVVREMQRLIALVRLPPYIASQQTKTFQDWKSKQRT